MEQNREETQSPAIRAFKPKGLRIYKGGFGTYHAAFKSTGRNGAAIRSRFARLGYGQRQSVLSQWAQGRAAALP